MLRVWWTTEALARSPALLSSCHVSLALTCPLSLTPRALYPSILFISRSYSLRWSPCTHTETPITVAGTPRAFKTKKKRKKKKGTVSNKLLVGHWTKGTGATLRDLELHEEILHLTEISVHLSYKKNSFASFDRVEKASVTVDSHKLARTRSLRVRLSKIKDR